VLVIVAARDLSEVEVEIEEFMKAKLSAILARLLSFSHVAMV
jgi:hypothetical protein